MPDITKCTNNECELSKSCHRFICEPSESQSYANFEPTINKELDEIECDYFIENRAVSVSQVSNPLYK